MMLALGAGNTIGFTGYFIGGGTSPFNSILGKGSDQILAARLVNTAGEVIVADEAKETELL